MVRNERKYLIRAHEIQIFDCISHKFIRKQNKFAKILNMIEFKVNQIYRKWCPLPFGNKTTQIVDSFLQEVRNNLPTVFSSLYSYCGQCWILLYSSCLSFGIKLLPLFALDLGFLINFDQICRIFEQHMQTTIMSTCLPFSHIFGSPLFIFPILSYFSNA